MKNSYLSVQQIRLCLMGIAVAVVMALLPGKLFAQAPAISYSSPLTFVEGTAITAQSPSNTGGAVASFGFGSASIVSTGVSDPVCMALDKSGNMYIGESSGKVSLLLSGGSTASVFASGFGPVNGIALDASNNVYLVDGAKVWKIPAGGGTAVSLSSFSNPVSLAFDSAGNLYVADNNIPNSFGGIFKISPDGSGKVHVAFADNPAGLAFDSNGALYYLDRASNVALWKIFGGGNGFVTSASNAGYGAVDATGNIYSAGSDGIRCYSPGMGSFTINAVATDGIVIDANYNLYYADGNNIYKMAPADGYFISPELPSGLSFNSSTGVISGTPTGTSPATNYSATAFNASGSSPATINITVNPALPVVSYSSPQSYQVGTAIGALSPSASRVASWGYSASTTAVSVGAGVPVDVAADAVGNLYAVEFNNNQVVKIPAGGGAAVVLSSAFSGPFGVAVDGSGNVYVADAGNNAVKEIIAGSGTVNTIGSGFSGPSAVAVDAAGNVYVGDTGNGALKKIPVGNGAPVTLQSGFATIEGVAVDAAGNIYVADAGVGTSGNGAVYKVPAGGGSMASVGTGFARPAAVAVDAAGNLYVSDINKSVITVIEPGGSQFTVGSGFDHANGVTFDTSGNLYIADAGTASIQEVKITGGYFLSPVLPAGLSFDSNTGIISGTPSVSSPTTSYTITGWNITGSAAATLSITVGAPVIAYNSPAGYTPGVAISPLTPNSTGGAVAGTAFSAATTLSPGITDATCVAVDQTGNLYIGESSGQVSKLAAGSSSATVYATGFAATTSWSQGIAVDVSGNVYFADGTSVWKIPAGGGAPVVLGSFAAAEGVAADAAGYIYVADASGSGGIFKMAADGTGRVKLDNSSANAVAVDYNGNVFFAFIGGGIYEIPLGGTKKFSSGLSSPVAVAADASGNSYGIGSPLQESVEMLPASGGFINVGPTFNVSGPAGLAVDVNFNIYLANGTVRKISPASGYFISPELPAGLTINPNTGVISGTTSVSSPATTYYTVTAFNTSASATASLILGPAPAMSYSTPQTFFAGTAITPLLPAAAGAAVSAPGFNTTTTALSTGITDATCTALDKNGNLYIGESSGKVSVLAPGGTAATVLAAGFSTGSVGGGIAVDATGNVYFVDGVWLWKIPAGGGTPVKLNAFSAVRQVAVVGGNILYISSGEGIFTLGFDGSNKTSLLNQFVGAAAFDQNGNTFFTSRGSQIGLHELPAGGTQKTIIPSVSFRAFTTDPSGNVYMVNFDYSIGMVPAGGSTESQVLPVTTGTTSIMIGPDLNLYTIVNGNIFKTNPTGGYFISPELPAGLTIDPTTGAISGTPAAASVATDYTVTAFSSAVGSTAPLNIAVPSPDASLSSLRLSAGTLSPVFASATITYTASVAYAVRGITITPTANQPGAAIAVNGVAVTSGHASASLPLSIGANTVSVVVTAPDGITTKTYTVMVTRAASLTDADLGHAGFSNGLADSIAPVFSPAVTNYSLTAPGDVASIRVTPRTHNPLATVTVNGVAVASKTTSDPIPLNVGSNIITLVVTAQDGTTTKTYTFVVTRLQSSDADLAYLGISHSLTSLLSPAFNPATTSYSVGVANEISLVRLVPRTKDPLATVTINGEAVASKATSSAIPLAAGNNTITTVVTAQDGTTKIYTVYIYRTPSTNADLAYMGISHSLTGSLSPAFDPATTSYTLAVTNDIGSLTVTPRPADATATVTVNGEAVASKTQSSPISLNIGDNTITVVVTAALAIQGLGTKTYTVTVTRAPAPLNALYVPVSVAKPAETLQYAEDGITVHQAISPNGDGQNDVLTIDGISNYPDNKLSIMSRNGQLVYEVKGYDNASKAFDGHSNKTGVKQLPGTYFYSLEYTVKGVAKRKTGFIVLKY